MSTDGCWAGIGALVTGGQGFVGAWLAERLVKSGARVVVPYRGLNPRSRPQTAGIAEACELVHADLTDYDSVRRLLGEHDIQAVFHLAAQPIVGVANRAPLSTFESNVRGTWTLLEACRTRSAAGAPLERIVIASSDHAYGSKEDVPHREDQPLTPRFPYDVSKACADMIART